MATLVCFMAESLVDLRKPHNIRVMSLKAYSGGLLSAPITWETASQEPEEIALKRQWKASLYMVFG